MAHVEAVVVSTESGASRETVRDWFSQRGFEVVPMRVGLLVSGDSAVFESVFGAALDTGARTASLPIPPELEAHVASITVPARRKPHA
jgi:hypothetical protein